MVFISLILPLHAEKQIIFTTAILKQYTNQYKIILHGLAEQSIIRCIIVVNIIKHKLMCRCQHASHTVAILLVGSNVEVLWGTTDSSFRLLYNSLAVLILPSH